METPNYMWHHVTGKSKYVGLARLKLTISLILYDLEPGEKETLFKQLWHATGNTGTRANMGDHHVQNIAITHSKKLGFDGWISTQDRGDSRLEVCIFRPDLTLKCTSIAFCGP